MGTCAFQSIACFGERKFWRWISGYPGAWRAWELGGSLAVGADVGFPAGYLTGRFKPDEPTQSRALGIVFLCAGLAIWLGVSSLLVGMAAGAIMVNAAKHHSRPFHEIEHAEWPFMILFFVLAGASLHLDNLKEISMFGIVNIVSRGISRVLGGRIGGRLAGAPVEYCCWIGLALVPQAGVALGMALVASNHFPDISESLLAITIGSMVVFELTGPLLTQIALRKVGEVD